MQGNAFCLAYGRCAACLFFSLRRFFAGYGGGVFLRRGFRVILVGVAVLVVVQLSDECVCAVSVPLERLSSRRTKGLSPRFVLAELLLFRELQTIVSAVAFA